MPRRKTTTPKVRAAARHNIKKAQVSRIRRREPRSLGRVRRQRERKVRVGR